MKIKKLLSLVLALLMIGTIFAQVPMRASAAYAWDELVNHIKACGEETEDGKMEILEYFHQSESVIIASVDYWQEVEDSFKEEFLEFSMLVTTDEKDRVDIFTTALLSEFSQDMTVEHGVLFYKNDKLYDAAYVDKDIKISTHSDDKKYSVISDCDRVTNTQLTGTFNSGLGALLAYWDEYIYEELNCTLQALGFTSYESEFAGTSTSGHCGKNLFWNLSGNTLTISGTGEMYSYYNYQNRDKDYPWDDVADDVVNVVVKEGVTSIEFGAFRDFENLESVTIAGSVATIENGAFANCSKLVTLSLGDGVEVINWDAFANCTALESVTIPNSVTAINGTAFSGCTALKTVTFGKGVKTIEYEAFSGCTALENLRLPEKLEVLGYSAFKNCGNLGSVTLPETIKAFGSEVFKGSTVSYNTYNGQKYLGSSTNPYYAIIELPSKNISSFAIHPDTKIITDAFSGCNNLTQVTIPNGVRLIGDYAFLECEELETVTISDTVQYIGESIFGDSVTDLTLGEGLLTLGDNWWDYDTLDCTQYNDGYYLGTAGNPYFALIYAEDVAKFKAHKNTKIVAAWVFEDCDNRKTVDLGESLITIDIGAFDCVELESLTLPKTLKYVCRGAFSVDGGYATIENVYYNGTKAQWNAVEIAEDNEPLLDAKFHFAKQERLTAPKLTVSGNTLSWNAVTNASSYAVYRATSKSGKYTKVATITETTWSDAPTAGKTYYYKVVAVCADDASLNSAYSNYVYIAYKLSAPEISVVNAASGKPYITWAKVSGAKKYTVYRATSENGKYSKLGTTTKTYYTDSKASAGNTYFYKVVANASKSTYNSGYSNIVSCGVICGTPSVTVKIDANTGKPSLSWGKVSGAAKYAVYRDGQLLTTVTAVTYADTTAAIDTRYTYAVQALGKTEDLNGAVSKAVSATSGIAKPDVKGSINAASGKPQLSWDAVEGAVKYEIYRSTKSNKSYKLIATVETTSYEDAAVSAGKTYYYQVKAIGEVSKSALSTYDKLTGKCATPTIAVKTNAKAQPVISWSKVSGAKKYTIYRSTSETSGYKSIGTSKTTSYTDTKATPGRVYYYKVIANASSSKYNSGYSNIVNCGVCCATPAVKVSNNSAGKVTLSWSKISGAVKYEVYLLGAEDYVTLGVVTGTSWTDTEAGIGEGRYYGVRAIAANEDYNSEVSEPVFGRTTCATPKITGKVGANKKPIISWGAVEGATKYIIYRSTSSSKGFAVIGETEDLSWEDLTAVKGKTYYYKVVAVGDNCQSAMSSYVKVKSK